MNFNMQKLTLNIPSDSLLLFSSCLDMIRKVYPCGLRIVDSATGHGRYAMMSRDKGFTTTAFDVRTVRVPSLEPGIRWLSSDINDFDYSPYDVVVLSGILYHLDIDMILNLFKKLKDSQCQYLILNTHFIEVLNGKIINSKFNLGNPYKIGDLELCDYIEKDRTHPLSSFKNPISHWLTIDSIEKLLILSGFTNNQILLPLVQNDRAFFLCER